MENNRPRNPSFPDENGRQSRPRPRLRPVIDDFYPVYDPSLPSSVEDPTVFLPETGSAAAAAANRGRPFPERFYPHQDQFGLETSLARLNLSSTSSFSPSPSPLGSVYNGGNNRDCFSDFSYLLPSDVDLQRLRVQAAISGQIGPLNAPHLQPDQTPEFRMNPIGTPRNHNFPPSTLDSALNRSLHDCYAHTNQYSERRPPSPIRHTRFSYEFLNNYLSYSEARRLSTVTNSSNPKSNFDFGSRGRSNKGRLGRPNSRTISSNLSISNNVRGRPCHASLEELRGKIAVVATDADGSRFLQTKLDDGNGEEIRVIFLELKEHLDHLMVNEFGNYVIEELFKVCTEDQITEVLAFLVEKEESILTVCSNENGTRVMRKFLEQLSTGHQRAIMVSLLRPLTVILSKDLNGRHVIEHCLKLFSNQENEVLLNEVADNSLDIAMDKSGCCALQQYAPYAHGELGERLFAEVVANALLLSEHPFGNFMVQFVLGRDPGSVADILAQLEGHYVSLSMSKSGSHVVEKCLKDLEQNQVEAIIREMVDSPNLLMVFQNPFGNYVAQTALEMAKGNLRKEFEDRIDQNQRYLQSNPCGKRVLECRKWGRKQPRRARN